MSNQITAEGSIQEGVTQCGFNYMLVLFGMQQRD